MVPSFSYVSLLILTKFTWFSYSSGKGAVVQVMVMVALAEELFAPLRLLVTSLLGMLVLAAKTLQTLLGG